jgi:hypothetical protein
VRGLDGDVTPDVTWEEYDELRRLRAEVAEYRQAITWDTTCLNCSSLLDANYQLYVRAEQAETQATRWKAAYEKAVGVE